MAKDYVELREYGFYLVGSGAPLDFLIREFQHGEPAESIRAH